jgi:hypothetical protein
MIMLNKHLRTPGQFQSLLLIILQWYQVTAGTFFCPFSRPKIQIPYIERSWLDSTREFLAHSSSSLTIEQTPTPQLQRQHDACI